MRYKAIITWVFVTGCVVGAVIAFVVLMASAR